MMLGQPAQQTAAQDAAQQQAIPDAPKPQGLPMSGTRPGMGAQRDLNGDDSTAPQETAPGTSLSQSPTAPRADEGPPPETPEAGQGPKAFTLRVQTNFVEVPFTVKDNKGRLVPGLTWRDVRVYENGLRQQMALFTVDPFPLSVALVIDQSLTYDNMTNVNNALGALQGAFTPYDEVAVFTYNNGPRLRTDFTAGQSPRLNFVIYQSKSSGRQAWVLMGGTLSALRHIKVEELHPTPAAVRDKPRT